MIVEDELIFALNLKRELENHGYTVLELINKGENALEEIKRSIPNCIMLDIRLGGRMTGIETAREIRKLTLNPIIFITGYSNQTVENEMKSIENSIFFSKPFAPEEIVSTIDQFLEQDSTA